MKFTLKLLLIAGLIAFISAAPAVEETQADEPLADKPVDDETQADEPLADDSISENKLFADEVKDNFKELHDSGKVQESKEINYQQLADIRHNEPALYQEDDNANKTSNKKCFYEFINKKYKNVHKFYVQREFVCMDDSKCVPENEQLECDRRCGPPCFRRWWQKCGKKYCTWQAYDMCSGPSICGCYCKYKNQPYSPINLKMLKYQGY